MVVTELALGDVLLLMTELALVRRDRQRQLRKWQKQFGKQMQEQKNKAPPKHRNASVQVRENWGVVEEMDFPRLSKLSLTTVGEPVDL